MNCPECGAVMIQAQDGPFILWVPTGLTPVGSI